MTIKYNKITKMVDVSTDYFRSYTMDYWRILQQRRRTGLRYLKKMGISIKKMGGKL